MKTQPGLLLRSGNVWGAWQRRLAARRDCSQVPAGGDWWEGKARWAGRQVQADGPLYRRGGGHAVLRPLDVDQAHRRVPDWLLPTQAWSSQAAQGPFLVPRPTAQCPSFLRVRGPTAASCLVLPQAPATGQTLHAGPAPAVHFISSPGPLSWAGPPSRLLVSATPSRWAPGSVLPSARGQRGPGRRQ